MQRKFMKAIRFFLYAILIIFLDSFVFERYFVHFPESEFYSKDLPVEFDGYKIAVVTDVHYGFLDPGSWIDWVFNRTNQKNPDAIVGLGDYVKLRRTNTEILHVWPILKNLKAKDGEFFVLGNHDHWANEKLSLSFLEKSKKSIRHKYKIIQRGKAKLVIAGTGDYWEDEVGIDKALKGSPKDAFRIVATHNPDASDTKHSEKVNLFLAGHTHGGQVRIPILGISPVLPVKKKNYDLGFHTNLFQEDIFISAGVGWSIFPIRFFCRAEVPIIVLRKSKGVVE